MTKEEVLEKSKPIFSEVFGDKENFELSTKLENFNMDSIRFITLLAKSEELFEIEISNENLAINKYIIVEDYIEVILYELKNCKV